VLGEDKKGGGEEEHFFHRKGACFISLANMEKDRGGGRGKGGRRQAEMKGERALRTEENRNWWRPLGGEKRSIKKFSEGEERQSRCIDAKRTPQKTTAADWTLVEEATLWGRRGGRPAQLIRGVKVSKGRCGKFGKKEKSLLLIIQEERGGILM